MSQYNGTFIYDATRSDSMDKILTVQGMGWVMRNIVNSLQQKLTLYIADGKITIKQETSLKNTETTLVLGGEPQEFSEDITGGPARRSCYFEPDGTLVQVVESDTARLVNYRTLEDNGKTLHCYITYQKVGGEKLTAERYFTRKE